MSPTVAIIGAGKMGETLLSGLLRAGWPIGQLVATARREERRTELADRYGVEMLANDAAAARGDVIVLAVKPQDMPHSWPTSGHRCHRAS